MRKRKGVRRKSLPEPNPTKIELKDSSLFDVFQKAIEMYYKGFHQVTLNDVMLAYLAGNALEIDDICEWKLGNKSTNSKQK